MNYIFVLILFCNVQMILSQNLEGTHSPSYDSTLSEYNTVDISSSEEEPIPLFLVDEGLQLPNCQNLKDIEKIKKCAISELEEILQKSLKSKIHELLDDKSELLISTSIVIDSIGNTQCKEIELLQNGKGLDMDFYPKLMVEIESVVKDFPKLSPAKQNGQVRSVLTNLKIQF